MEILEQILNTTLNSFDFGYCLVVNIATFLIIKLIDELNKDKQVNTWIKRLVLLGVILITGVVYYLTGNDVRLVINSAILAPVSWSWIFKPICKKLKVDYKQIDKELDKEEN